MSSVQVTNLFKQCPHEACTSSVQVTRTRNLQFPSYSHKKPVQTVSKLPAQETCLSSVQVTHTRNLSMQCPSYSQKKPVQAVSHKKPVQATRTRNLVSILKPVSKSYKVMSKFLLDYFPKNPCSYPNFSKTRCSTCWQQCIYVCQQDYLTIHYAEPFFCDLIFPNSYHLCDHYHFKLFYILVCCVNIISL